MADDTEAVHNSAAGHPLVPPDIVILSSAGMRVSKDLLLKISFIAKPMAFAIATQPVKHT